MALLTLKDIGKIYVSEGNVTVGIRGVNLSFERGEFVAITGKSGSGKSTLLNVISGMDSYEEGELLIEGQTTSHYLQPDWEAYREQYISFIFQDYNIIESFTVLQNVELALLHIEDKKERRRRALELLRRVGLSAQVKQKGSKLSGGQKQRTVIARALAKDSPIILADEPTGNLDSATSAEIIELLREVSRDKLLIVVTHNFEQVEACATRHIRVFDGAIESDHAVRPAEPILEEDVSTVSREKKQDRKKQLQNGLILGRTIFTAKPKLSVFLCFLMIVGTLGIFLVTTLCGGAADMFDPYYMFRHIDGRVILTTQNGEVLSEEQVQAIANEYGATVYLRHDVLLDEGIYSHVTIPVGSSPMDWEYVNLNYTYGEDFGEDIIGRYPSAANEVFLYLPISYQPAVGKESLAVSEILLNNMNVKLTGVKYYYDNNQTPMCLFTEEGFRTATAVHYLYNFSNLNITLSVKNGSANQSTVLYSFRPSFDMEADKVYVSPELLFAKQPNLSDVSLNFSATYYKYNYYYEANSQQTMTFSRVFTGEDIISTRPALNDYDSYYDSKNEIIISDELLREMAEEVLDRSYKQVSLFFGNDKIAHEAAARLQAAGYIAVPSDTTYEPDAGTAVMNIITSLMLAFVWILSIIFLAFFINLCSSRTLGAFKSDMAIMRSMGIQVKVIRVAMYVRMLISLIPAFLLVVLTAFLIFTTPKFNEFFVYLYAWQYALIFIGMVALTVRITYKQIRRLFGESVKKSLKGGAAE